MHFFVKNSKNMRLDWKTKNPFLDMGLHVIFQKFEHFQLKDNFVSLSQKFWAKTVIFCDFLKKSSFLVIFDTKNRFYGSFPFQKCIL